MTFVSPGSSLVAAAPCETQHKGETMFLLVQQAAPELGRRHDTYRGFRSAGDALHAATELLVKTPTTAFETPDAERPTVKYVRQQCKHWGRAELWSYDGDRSDSAVIHLVRCE